MSTPVQEEFPQLTELVGVARRLQSTVHGARKQFEQENVEGEYYWLRLACQKSDELFAQLKLMKDSGWEISNGS